MTDPRNAIIAALSALVLLLGGILLWERLPEQRPPPAGPIEPSDASLADRESVTVIDLVLDRERLSRFELIFDRPLGDDVVGEVLARDPAVLSPRVGGTWSWVAANVLRFTPTSRLTPATRFDVSLSPERLLSEGQVLLGEQTFAFQTDAFQVERVDAHEEPEPEGGGVVTLRGEIRFNYPVDPRELARKLRLVDPSRDDAEVEVELETSYARKVIGWHSAAVQKTPEERALRLTILSDLTSSVGNVPLAADTTRTLTLGSSERLVVRGVEATSGEKRSTLEIELSSPVDASIAEDYLEVTPAVELQLASQGNELVLRGGFRPGERYAIRLRAGLPATDDAALAEPYEKEVLFADLAASVAFQSEGMFLPATGSRRVAVESVNVDRVTLTVDRVYRNNVLYLVQQRGYQVWRDRGYGGIDRVFGDRVVEKEIALEASRNRTALTELALDEHFDAEEPGFYRIGLRRVGAYALVQRWLLVTDLGVVAKKGRGGMLVWVSSFADLAPIPGVRVRVVSNQNQLVDQGATDARGLLQLRGLAEEFEASPPAYLVAERGGDWSFVPLDRTRIDTSDLDVAGAAPPASGFDAFLYGERDLYRPGETARGVAVLRDRRLAAPEPMPARLRHRDPEGRERGSQRLDVDAAGVAEWTHEIDAIARTGAHALELVVGEDVVGRYRFQVEEFVPDRIRVRIDPPAAALGPGDALPYGVESAYLFGPPSAGLAVETRVRLEAERFAPPGHAGFTFANEDREFSPREIMAREGALDAAGRAAFEASLPAGLEVPSSLAAVLTARVRERGGRGVAAQVRVPVHPYDRYVGLRRLVEGYAEPGEPAQFAWVSVTPDGAPAPAGRLRAEFYRDEWHTVLRRTAAGTFRYESELDARLVDTQSLEPGSSGGELTFTPSEYGRYRVVLTDHDGGGSARVQFYASGWGFAPWAVENPGRIELDVEKDDYAPGERAVVQVRAPFAGRLLLTVEREDVLHTEVHVLDGNTAAIPLTLRADWRPNVYVTATLVRSARDLEPGAAARAFGAASVNVDRLRHRLDVSVDVAAEMRPRGPLEVTVASAPGARVTVAAVDEGVLQLISQETPDPFAHFYRKRALGVSAHDIFSLLLPELDAGAAAGGGRADAARAQFLSTAGIRRAKPVAFWSGVLTADASGEATASFDVPEFQGALRVMAVAHDGPDFGAASAETRVRDPLVLLPTFPRFLAPGERAVVPLTVRNDTGVAGDFTVSLEPSGAARLGGPGSQSVAVADGAEATLSFSLETDADPGAVTLVARAEGADERASVSAELSVRPDLPDVTLDEAGVLGETTFALAGDGGGALRGATLRRSLRVGPTPLVRLAGALRSVLRYPYGCLEQTVSRAFPLLHLADLARELEPDLFEKHDPDAAVADAIRRAGAMQVSNGGFALWPRGREADPWASVYTAHFLVEARRAGHEPPSLLVDGALEFTRAEAVAKPRYSGPELERVVYALYVLARAGEADVATMDFVREKHAPDLLATSRVLLGAAYASTGDPDALAELAGGLADAEVVRRQTGANFRSTTRNRALFLLALLDVAPDDPRVRTLAQRLARDATTQRWNTQETSFALLALGQLHTRAADAEYRGSVVVGGATIGAFENETRVFEDLPAEGAIELRLDPGSQLGAAYWSLSLRGTPTDAAFAPASEGLELERVFLDRDGNALSELVVQQGDLVVARLRVRSTAGRLDNVVLQNLLPSGFEVENPRLDSSESLPWVKDADLQPRFVDVRDDRVLLFVDLPDPKWRTTYALLRAVTPGRFRLPPVQAEAMYEPTVRATGERGFFEVELRP